MYWSGEDIQEKPWESDEAWQKVAQKKMALAQTPVEDIIAVLDSFSKLWVEGSEFYLEALPQLVRESGFAFDEVKDTLSLLPGLLSRESLEKRLRAEFNPPKILNEFAKTPHFSGRVRAMPLGVVLHVTAGNIFLGCIDSLIMGLITKNFSLIKVSGQNKFFPLYFAQKLALHDVKKVISDKFAILHWKGGDRAVEDLMKSKVNAIIAWGGEEMIESYRQGLPPGTKFLDFGPKISIQVVSFDGLDKKSLGSVAEKIVADISPWDQSACASPQNLYLQEGIDEVSFTLALEEAFQNARPGGSLDADESVEILKEYYRGLYSQLMEGGQVKKSKDHLIHLEKNNLLRPSPLHRSLLIKRFRSFEDLKNILAPFAYYLQSCSYLLGEEEKDFYLSSLALAGIKRFAPLGSITWGMEGAPHDGRLVLRELTSLVGDELRAIDYRQEVSQSLSSSKDLKLWFEKKPHPEGYIFSSGGTTGEPKFVHFSYQEFDHITDMLAHNLRSQGVEQGMTVANLFVAGNLWSSFMAVEKALEKLGAIQLPIGGLCSVENIKIYLKKFSPDVVMGIPSLLIQYAQEVKLKVPMVFYAGEALSPSRRDFLSETWETQYFGSAGYASVDAGIIAYQCSHSAPGEHHLFSDLVEMDIIDDEIVVTSLYRTSMPIKNYRTGDRGEWIEDCTCGRKDKRFRLLGRVDSLIQIWSCRLLLGDIEKSIQEVYPQVKSHQVVVGHEGIYEKMGLFLEGVAEDRAREELISRIYTNSRDLRDTISLQDFKSKIDVQFVNEIKRNDRTGKISQVLDLRH